MHTLLTPEHLLPEDHAQAVLVGRIWVEGVGPVLVRVNTRTALTLATSGATMISPLAGVDG